MSSSRERIALANAWLERAPDRHHLADRLHVGREPVVDAGELLEREARPLDDDVVDRRLEGGRRAARDVVGDLVERGSRPRAARRSWRSGSPVAFEASAEERDTRGFISMTTISSVCRVDRELDVGAAGLDADRADHRDRLVAQLLVLAVGQRLLRRDGDRVAGVHAHRVDVLDRADDHDVVGAVAHDLELELAPAEHRLVEQHLADRRRRRARARRSCRTPPRVRAMPPPRPPSVNAGRTMSGRPNASSAAWPRRRSVAIVLRAVRRPAVVHRRVELLAVLGAADRLVGRADQLDAELVERAVLVQRLGEVERGLAAERRQQRVRALALDHLAHRVGQQRLDVGAGRELRVGHDRRRVRVDEDDLVALLEQHLAGLRAGVVELGGLADDDRARAEDEDLVEVVAPRHRRWLAMKSSNRPSESFGPGPASGWYWTQPAGTSSSRSALDRAVVEVHVRELGLAEVGLQCALPGSPPDREAVVLGGDRDPPGRAGP